MAPPVLAALLLSSSPASFAADEPEQVPWERIEAWVRGAAPVAVPETSSKTQPAAPADASPPAPGNRRAEPTQARELRQLVLRLATERLQQAQSRRDWKDLFEVHYLMAQYDKALDFLVLMLSDRRYKDEADSDWLCGKLWETGILVTPRPRQDRLDAYYEEWCAKRLKFLADHGPGWSQTHRENMERAFKERQEYYRGSANLVAELKDLDLRGDSDSAALWQLCLRYGRDRPWAPLSYALCLYRMREWYPQAEPVTGGDAQWRLVRVLDGGLDLHKQAGDETEFLMKNWPEATWVKGANGDALWHLAGCRSRQGDLARQRGNKNEAIAAWREAREQYRKYQNLYPDTWRNKPRDRRAPRPPSSDCQERLAELREKLASEGAR